MDLILNELEAYPELKTWTLVNNYTGDSRIVTDQQLIDAFGEEELLKIKANRNTAWLVYENF